MRHNSSRKCHSGVKAVELSQEVEEAIREGRPVIALESTIISHGMPYPRNLKVAREVEALIRKNGVVPATCAVIAGVPKVGLSDEELEHLARDEHITKASRRDLAAVCANGTSAATTVAGTMILAHAAGIRVFATGGLGGVHHGAETSFDISADIVELGRTPIAVVCGGVKSILNIEATLEVLETNGVPVLTVGGTTEFPAFFTNESGIQSPLTASTAQEIASMLHESDKLGLANGCVVAVPNPAPARGEEIKKAIDSALEEARAKGISGAAMTPFLLASIETQTGGNSLDSNIALVMSNARMACDIAHAYNALIGAPGVAADAGARTGSQSKTETTAAQVDAPVDRAITAAGTGSRSEPADVLVFGGAVVDTVGQLAPGIHVIPGSSNPGSVQQSYGGVARNISEGLGRLGAGVALVAAVGEDEAGRGLVDFTRASGVDVRHMLSVPTGSTASYIAIHQGDGDLVVGMADMGMTNNVDTTAVDTRVAILRDARVVVTDANIPAPALARVMRLCTSYNVQFVFEPTSDHKCLCFASRDMLGAVAMVKPNFSELVAILNACLHAGLVTTGRAALEDALARAACESAETVGETTLRVLALTLQQLMAASASTEGSSASALLGITAAGKPHLVAGKHVIVSLGARGALWCGPAEKHTPHKAYDVVSDNGVACKLVSCPVIPSDKVVNSSGAGDTLLAGTLYELLMGKDILTSLQHGLRVASLAVQSSAPCPPNIMDAKLLQ